MEALKLELRAMESGDLNYIRSSWMRSLSESNEWRRSFDRAGHGRGVPPPVFFRLYMPVVEALLARCTVVVATMPEAVDVVLGWLATEGDTLHYLLVKPRWRQLGVGARLIAGTESMSLKYTHEPPPWWRVPESWTYEPMLRFDKEAA